MKPTNPNNKKRPYSCPKCGGLLWVKTDYSGYDVEMIGARSGKVGKVLANERTVVTDETVTCSMFNCDWVAPYFDFEDEE